MFQECQPRGDYKEFLELSCIFLGAVPPEGVRFRTPGAVHHARWLAKALYCLKMFLFKDQLKLKPKEVNGLRDICVFIVIFYLESWFYAPSAIRAPHQDLRLLQELIRYRKINSNIADAALVKLRGHLWYLSEHLAALSFFDETVPYETKLKMAHSIKERAGTTIVVKRIQIEQTDYESLLRKDVSDFITTNSLFLFHQYDLPYDFLDICPKLWHNNKSFNECLKVFKSLKVVNDIAERKVALMEEFNLLLTKDEDQKQNLLQVVSHHRELHPDCHKKNIIKSLNKKESSDKKK